MLERIDVFCECGHKVFDRDPEVNINGSVKCVKCEKVSYIHTLRHVKRKATEKERVLRLQWEKERSYPFYGGRLL